MKILLVALMAMFAMSANAGIIIPDGNPGSLSAQTFSGNDVVGARAGLVNKGGNLIEDYNSGAMFDITFTYIGSEAGYSNDFDFGLNVGSDSGTTRFNNKSGTATGDTISFTGLSFVDALDFGFYSNNSTKGVRNGANTTALGDSGFATLFNTSAFTYNGFAFGEFDAIIGFDDSGAGPDGDYDDLVIGINVSRSVDVPEPGTLALMGLGLAGLAASRKRK